MLRFALLACAVGVCLAVPMQNAQTRTCDQPSLKDLPFCNPKLSTSDRVADLVSRLTLAEKYTQFANGADGIPRLSIAPTEWWGEALHGVAFSPSVDFESGDIKCATSFPQVVGTGATFNKTLWSEIASVISTEARAMSNNKQAGLTYWSPVINLIRDPRWGRLQESPGEDPFLVATYGGQFATGMQDGEDMTHIKASSCCKHFLAYSLENWHNMDRYHFDAITTPRDLADSYLPSFEGCVREGRASSVMCSYNAVNGVPSCANKDLLTGVVREAWGFEGYIVSDCDAVGDVFYSHHYVNSTSETCEATLSAGMDLDCGKFVDKFIPAAVDQGIVKESLMDSALRNLFAVRFRLGEFDPVESQPYLTYGPEKVATKASWELSKSAAHQSIVLLKNSHHTLPLAEATHHHPQTFAMIGPHANASDVMLGSYFGQPCRTITPLAAFSAASHTTATLAAACDGVKCNSTAAFAQAEKLASESDVSFVFVGLSLEIENEALDRDNLTLPGFQSDLVSAVAKAANGKPVVVVIMSGGPLDISDMVANDAISAILWVGYPGPVGGEAIHDVVFGKYNPGGRLSVTWYPNSFTEEASLFDMGMRPNATNGNPGRTYRFYTGKPIFPFGYGLSYTSFEYKTKLSSSVVEHTKVAAVAANSQLHYLRGHKNDESVVILTVTVSNTGKVAGSDAVLVFVHPPGAPGVTGNPIKQLVGFERVFLHPGQSVNVEFPIMASDLTMLNEDAVREGLAGEWTIQVGSESAVLSVQ